MRALLDTHVFLWWVDDSPKLSERSRDIIADEHNEILFSVVSAWEIVIKVGVGKLSLTDPPDTFIPEQLSQNDMEILPMSLDHALRVHELPDHHKDPFDRLLVAQSLVEGIPVISADPGVSRYPVEVIS